MPTLNSAFPVIDDADLKAAREFLTMNTVPTPREDQPRARRKPGDLTARSSAVTVHHGITRARGRISGSKARD